MKNWWRKLCGWLRVLVTPRCWLQLYPYSPTWDKRLNELMEEHSFKQKRSHVASIGGETVWISNHPYASMRPYPHNFRPKRITVLRAWDKMQEDVINESDKG